MAEISVVVTLGATEPYEATVGACERAGLSVERRLEPLGVVTGRIEAGRLEELRRVVGVVAVEEERSVTLPPPDRPS
ncbi:MAG: hypothetical protein OHK0015_23510 [Chloroflexi bacterium OHK40]